METTLLRHTKDEFLAKAKPEFLDPNFVEAIVLFLDNPWLDPVDVFRGRENAVDFLEFAAEVGETEYAEAIGEVVG